MTSDQKPGCLGAFFRRFTRPDSLALETQELLPDTLPYRVRDDFLSHAEISLYHILYTITKETAVVCPKVGLKDIFFTTTAEHRQAHFNRIARKHVDFLLCHPKTMKPLVGVELDDSSHSAESRQERDNFVNHVFEAAQLPLIRIKAQRSYNTEEVRAAIEEHITHVKSSVIDAIDVNKSNSFADASFTPAPLCPKCGTPMLLRTASRGTYQGSSFYGCQNYPQCRETQPFIRT